MSDFGLNQNIYNAIDGHVRTLNSQIRRIRKGSFADSSNVQTLLKNIVNEDIEQYSTQLLSIILYTEFQKKKIPFKKYINETLQYLENHDTEKTVSHLTEIVKCLNDEKISINNRMKSNRR